MKAARGGAARPELTLRRALEALGLDVTYERGEGSRLWHGTPDPSPVWDFLGGYGSTFFGHNHPDLVEAARAFLESGRVTHGQGSVRPAAEALKGELARRLHESCGGRFEVVLASTGSEAVEVAARHAEEALLERRTSLASWIERPPGVVGEGPWTGGTLEVVRSLGLDPSGDLLRLAAEHNERVLSEAPVHLAVERAYHGMTARARSLTDGREDRCGRRLEALRVVFVHPTDPGAVGGPCRGTPVRHCSSSPFRARVAYVR